MTPSTPCRVHRDRNARTHPSMAFLVLLATAFAIVGVDRLASVVSSHRECSGPCFVVSTQLGFSGVAALAVPKPPPRSRNSNKKQSSSASVSSGGPRDNKKPKRKQGGANANWYNKRKAGVRVSSRGPKAPRWEKEGDHLYVSNRRTANEGNGGNGSQNNPFPAANDKDMTREEALGLLRKFEASHKKASSSKEGPSSGEILENSEDEDATPATKPEPPFLWGGLSVGPVWKSRLLNAGYLQPTPIQVASYGSLASKKNQTSLNGNAVIAAPTGSGKSLAYLLPFLTTSVGTSSKPKKKSPNRNDRTAKRGIHSPAYHPVTSAIGRIWIVTPTMELAYQLQRTVDKLIAGEPSSNKESSSSSSSSKALHVLEYKQKSSNDAKEKSWFSKSYPMLSDILHQYYCAPDARSLHEPAFFSGTPKAFAQLRKEMRSARRVLTKSEKEMVYGQQRQEGSLVEDEERDGKNNDHEEERMYTSISCALRDNLMIMILDEVDRLLQTTTEATRRENKTTKPLAQNVLQDILWEKEHLAETGRNTARGKGRNSQPLSPKLQIVCASATIGRSLRRQLMQIVKAPSMDRAAKLITADVRTKKNAELRKASLLPSNLRHSYLVLPKVDSKDEAITATLRALVLTLRAQETGAPSLVFPGTIGVESVRDYLVESGFRDVRGLSSLQRDGPNDGYYGEIDDMPVYVVKERLARGLDLPEVRKVFLLGIPPNAAAYAHLAGRTARQNTPGECIVLFRPSETSKLVSIAETLGLYNLNCIF